MIGGNGGGHISLPLMNSFNKTEAAIFPMPAMLSKDFLFSQFIKKN